MAVTQSSSTYTNTSSAVITTYTINASINGHALTESGTDWNAVFSQLKVDLYDAWFDQNLCDPDGRLLSQDFNIINLSMPNASTYELAAASQGASPDSSLLSLLMSNAQASNATSILSTNIIDTGTDSSTLNLTNTTFAAALAAMRAAGAAIAPTPPGTIGRDHVNPEHV